jgi:hypothetical protein
MFTAIGGCHRPQYRGEAEVEGCLEGERRSVGIASPESSHRPGLSLMRLDRVAVCAQWRLKIRIGFTRKMIEFQNSQ